MEINFKSNQVEIISTKLNISQTMVESIIDEYTDELKQKAFRGETIKFLNICYIRSAINEKLDNETLAYKAEEIGRKLKIGGETVLRVLNELENVITVGLENGQGFCIRGIVRMRVEGIKGVPTLRTRKSTVYEGTKNTVSVINYFKKKVEVNYIGAGEYAGANA